MSERALRIGVVGDIHLHYEPIDSRLLDAQNYDLILFVGDLATFSHRGGLAVARAISRLRTPAWVVAGNHDAAHVGQMAAEVLEADPVIPLLNLGQGGRRDALEAALSPVVLAGYARYRLPGRSLDLIVGRPHSAGGPRLAFRPHLRERYGVANMDDSARLLCRLVDESYAEELLFLAHNGPAGLGAEADDLWGCDFRANGGDFGDPDLKEAVDYAKEKGKRVRAVVAGHMHHALAKGGERRARRVVGDTLYLNAARVPRTFERLGRTLRHHVELTLDAEGTRAHDILLTADVEDLR